MADAPIHTLATILEPRGSVLYQVKLSNGKTLLAHLSKPLALAGTMFPTGATVRIELTPYDFDQARILGAEDPQPGSLADAEAAEDHS
ncbi:MAG: translation initiation factor IF-1 [Akkermansiaceae bacterium]|nr:translation initiation factor IF-1 [Akkermansiaceae bacterium]